MFKKNYFQSKHLKGFCFLDDLLSWIWDSVAFPSLAEPPTPTSEQGCDLKLWHVATPGGGWLAFRFYHREEDEEAAAYFAIPDVRLLSCESLWRTWRGNQLIRRRQLLLSIFLPSHQKSLENQYCLPVNNTFCHLEFLILPQSYGFPAWQLWLAVQVQLKSLCVCLFVVVLVVVVVVVVVYPFFLAGSRVSWGRRPLWREEY